MASVAPVRSGHRDTPRGRWPGPSGGFGGRRCAGSWIRHLPPARSGGRAASERARRRSARGVRDGLPYPLLAPRSLPRLPFPGRGPVLRVCTDRCPRGSRPSAMALMGFLPRGTKRVRSSPARLAARTVVLLRGSRARWPDGPAGSGRTDVLGRSLRSGTAARATHFPRGFPWGPFEAPPPGRMGSGLPAPALLWFAERRSHAARAPAPGLRSPTRRVPRDRRSPAWLP